MKKKIPNCAAKLGFWHMFLVLNCFQNVMTGERQKWTKENGTE